MKINTKKKQLKFKQLDRAKEELEEFEEARKKSEKKEIELKQKFNEQKGKKETEKKTCENIQVRLKEMEERIVGLLNGNKFNFKIFLGIK